MKSLAQKDNQITTTSSKGYHPNESEDKGPLAELSSANTSSDPSAT